MPGYLQHTELMPDGSVQSSLKLTRLARKDLYSEYLCQASNNKLSFLTNRVTINMTRKYTGVCVCVCVCVIFLQNYRVRSFFFVPVDSPFYRKISYKSRGEGVGSFRKISHSFLKFSILQSLVYVMYLYFLNTYAKNQEESDFDPRKVTLIMHNVTTLDGDKGVIFVA